MLGCTDTQVHANVVAKQLHRMSHSDLPMHALVDAVVVTSKTGFSMDASEKRDKRMGKAHVPALLENRKERSRNILMD